LTVKEIEKLGGKIRDGEPGQQIYYAGRFHPQRRADDEEDEDRQSKFHKDYVVYNVEQCECGDGVYSHIDDVKRCFARFADLGEREREFVESLSQRRYPFTPRQRRWLDDILARLSA